MPILFIVIIGAAAGFLATRMMRVQTDVLTTIVIGIVGSLLGWVLLRVLLALSGFAAMFVGGVLGAMGLIWLWRRYISR